ncbi:unnamed protein product [Callosobruchus maculatus]|uniref:Uncharacterized protein n=1 Tax=Callosobruchus maculatus TaxID=64391 RepID=A0A653CI01_CALMS|nr:unnamed protein product [Callosobruchus maculatus]
MTLSQMLRDKYYNYINDGCTTTEFAKKAPEMSQQKPVSSDKQYIADGICGGCGQYYEGPSNFTSESERTCSLCKNEELVKNQRKECVLGQKGAAEKMLNVSNKKLKPLELGQTVAIEVPKVDRGPLDPKNILRTIVNISNDVYQIGTIHGLLNRWFSRDEMTDCQSSEVINIPEDKVISLREALRVFSKFERQGFKKCSCKPSKYLPQNVMPGGPKIYKDKVYITMPKFRAGVPATLAYFPMMSKKKTNILISPFPSWKTNYQGNCWNLQSVLGTEVDQEV